MPPWRLLLDFLQSTTELCLDYGPMPCFTSCLFWYLYSASLGTSRGNSTFIHTLSLASILTLSPATDVLTDQHRTISLKSYKSIIYLTTVLGKNSKNFLELSSICIAHHLFHLDFKKRSRKFVLCKECAATVVLHSVKLKTVVRIKPSWLGRTILPNQMLDLPGTRLPLYTTHMYYYHVRLILPWMARHVETSSYWAGAFPKPSFEFVST